MDVPEVSGQLGEFSFDIESGAVPVDQGVGGKSVAIMPISALASKAWSFAIPATGSWKKRRIKSSLSWSNF